MNRRSFLKAISAAAGVSFIPDISFAFQKSLEPEWIVEYENYDMLLAVAARWKHPDGNLLYAVQVPAPEEEDKKFVIESCKQALRQWYKETGFKKIRRAA